MPLIKLILLDQAESPLFHLELECADKFGTKDIEIIVADICDRDSMESIFNDYKPQLVYHAAAYKHVPMMETNASEAVRTNVNGTMKLANLAMKFKVEKFIMISTDKAVKPTSVMGASKRIAEMYTQSYEQQQWHPLHHYPFWKCARIQWFCNSSVQETRSARVGQ